MILIRGCRIQILNPNHINFACFVMFFLIFGIVFLCLLKLVFDLNLLRNLDKTSTSSIRAKSRTETEEHRLQCIEKVIGRNDFGLWKMMMEAILIQ